MKKRYSHKHTRRFLNREWNPSLLERILKITSNRSRFGEAFNKIWTSSSPTDGGWLKDMFMSADIRRPDRKQVQIAGEISPVYQWNLVKPLRSFVQAVDAKGILLDQDYLTRNDFCTTKRWMREGKKLKFKITKKLATHYEIEGDWPEVGDEVLKLYSAYESSKQ